jgi:uncharacterized protein
VPLTCQRCLTPYAFHIQSDSTILLAKDEQAADQLEILLQEDDQGLEIIVGSKTLNVIELIEDEALLALPLSPRHEVCPADVQLNATTTQEKTSPFAVLKEQLVVEKRKK